MNRFPPEVYLVDEILGRYVAIHNEIFSFSWRKIIPIPGLFKAIDYPNHSDQLQILANQLAESLSSPLDERLPLVFPRYVDALLRTVSSLREICSRLSEKNEGSRYSMGEYNAAVAAYKQLIAEYTGLGAELDRELGAL